MQSSILRTNSTESKAEAAAKATLRGTTAAIWCTYAAKLTGLGRFATDIRAFLKNGGTLAIVVDRELSQAPELEILASLMSETGFTLRRWRDEGGSKLHAKVYAGQNSDGTWSALVTSSNLTEAGFGSNVEAGAVVGGPENQNDLRGFLDGLIAGSVEVGELSPPKASELLPWYASLRVVAATHNLDKLVRIPVELDKIEGLSQSDQTALSGASSARGAISIISRTTVTVDLLKLEQFHSLAVVRNKLLGKGFLQAFGSRVLVAKTLCGRVTLSIWRKEIQAACAELLDKLSAEKLKLKREGHLRKDAVKSSDIKAEATLAVAGIKLSAKGRIRVIEHLRGVVFDGCKEVVSSFNNLAYRLYFTHLPVPDVEGERNAFLADLQLDVIGELADDAARLATATPNHFKAAGGANSERKDWVRQLEAIVQMLSTVEADTQDASANLGNQLRWLIQLGNSRKERLTDEDGEKISQLSDEFRGLGLRLLRQRQR